MNNIRSHLKIYLVAVVLVVFTMIVFEAITNTRANFLTRLEDLARIRDEVNLVDPHLTGPSKLEELARIKDDVFLGDARLTGSSRLEELARIKEDGFPGDTRLTGPSRLEELARIKER